MRFKSNVVSINVWHHNEKFPRQYGCTEPEIKATMAHFEHLLNKGKIKDYEMYGFANFQNLADGTDFGDRVYIQKRREEKAG